MALRRLSAVAAAIAVSLLAVAPVAAQDAPGDTTSTTLPWATTTTTTTTTPSDGPGEPEASTTTTSSTMPDPAAENDAPAEEAPPTDVTVPPPAPPANEPGALSEDAVAAARARQASRVLFRNLEGARETAAAAERDLALAQLHLADTKAVASRLARRLGGLRREHRLAVARLAEAKETLSDRAAWAYMRGPLHEMTSVLDAKDPNDMYRRRTMVASVLEADHDALVEYRNARQAVSEEVLRLTEDLEDGRRAVVLAEEGLWKATHRVEETAYELAIVTAGSHIVIHGFVFPVGEPHLFVDTFLAPRMPGTEYEHLHQGTDIFAPAGTPLLACERGVITKMGSDVLGGIKLWLVGESGARYYYAHLSAFADGIKNGDVVEAGTIVGYVGNTGNAVGTPSHLHFEIHPGAGPAVNPFPLLKAVDEVD